MSLQSPGTRDRLAPQGWAYTALQLGPEERPHRSSPCCATFWSRPKTPGRAGRDDRTRGADRQLTVTEKGYCHEPSTGRLNADHPDIRHDLDNPLPRSAPGFLVRALQARRAAASRPSPCCAATTCRKTAMSCVASCWTWRG
ncbi:hypothetical protein FLP41_09995 [Paracoccus marcusii]|nr:hypothetical protein FLP41_09995 [Paracoccus marcusii]